MILVRTTRPLRWSHAWKRPPYIVIDPQLDQIPNHIHIPLLSTCPDLTTLLRCRNDHDDCWDEVYDSVKVRDSAGGICGIQTHRTVLHKEDSIRCGANGSRIALRSVRATSSNFNDMTDTGRLPNDPPALNGISRAASPSSRQQMI